MLFGRAPTVLDSLNDLTDPKWKGRIGWAPTNGSFQAMVTAMRVIWGEGPTKEWLKGIQANEPKIYPKNTPQVAAVESGEIDIGFVNHYYVHRFLAEYGDSFSARKMAIENFLNENKNFEKISLDSIPEWKGEYQKIH